MIACALDPVTGGALHGPGLPILLAAAGVVLSIARAALRRYL